jgi:hypothetical protein
VIACRPDGEPAREAVREAAPVYGCYWPAVDTAGWQVVDAGPFVFKAPPELREQVVTGVDTYVGTWLAGERALAFDYGPRTTDPRERPDTVPGAGWSCETPIGGRAAVVRASVREVPGASGATARHAVAEGWWRDAGDGNRLLVIGWGPAADSAGRAAALAVIHSVRFRTAWTAADSLRQLHRFCRMLQARAARDTASRREWEERRPSCPSGQPPPTDYESVR